MESDSFLTTHIDILFTILSFLPTEDLARAKLVCRTWFYLIRHPTFLHHHCTRPTPIAAFFTQNQEHLQIHHFKPLSENLKFPSCIMGFLGNNQLISTNHGLICFRNMSGSYALGNPATYLWTVLNDDKPLSDFSFHGGAIIFNPSVSYHFKLAIALMKVDNSDLNTHYIQFHLYSSETCSWTVSSVFTGMWNSEVLLADPEIREYGDYHPCNIGGGSVCWVDGFDFLVGYEVATDTYWRSPLPNASGKHYSVGIKSYNGVVYCIMLGLGEGRVLRLDGKDKWVLEGEAKNENLYEFGHIPFAYDKARGALLIGGTRNNQVCAFDLSTSEVDIIVEGEGPWFPSDGFDLPRFPHANTLAPFFGGELTNWG